MQPPLFFDDWQAVVRTIIVGGLAYVAMVALVRISGKRTLSKMNAFDLIVTVALGSTLAAILVDEGVALAEGVTALALLIGLQFLVTWSSIRAPWVRRVVTGEPQLLARDGELLREAMRRTRIAEDEVHAAVRASGHADVRRVAAVVLETDGSLSVIGSTEPVRPAPGDAAESPASLGRVRGAD